MREQSEHISGAQSAAGSRAQIVFRHPAALRITHWVGVFALAILLMSGLQILNAHPALDFGQTSDFVHPPVSVGVEQKGGREIGVTRIFGRSFNTTGFLGLSGKGNEDEHAFPAWLTLPGYQDLAFGRRWHFFFAWILLIDGLVYLIWSLASGHLWRDLIPSWRQLRRIGTSIFDHARLRFPRGEEAKRYNVLQRLSYLLILFVVLPLLILAGLTMSPGLDAAFPWLTGLLGGRQSARTIHFVCACLITGFALVHIAMVLLSGFLNNMRSVITGWYKIEPETAPHG